MLAMDVSISIRIHPSKLYTGPRPRGKLWSSTVFFSGFLFQQSSTTSTSSPFTSFCIFHYQLQFRDYGGSLAHCLHIFSYMRLDCTCLCWTEGARTFILLTSPQFDSGKVLLQFSRYFTVNSTFETMGDVLHILSNFAFSYMQLECTFFFCWTYVPVQFSQATLLPFLAAKARGGRRAGRPRSLLRVTHLLLWHSAPKRETSGHEPCCASRGLTPF